MDSTENYILFGDNVLIKAKVKGSKGNELLIEFDDADSLYWIHKENVVKENELKAWNNGAVEEADGVRGIRWMNKDAGNYNAIHHTSATEYKFWRNNGFNNIIWMYDENFPMPLDPEPKISSCPVCGENCYASLIPGGETIFCKNKNCGYRVGTLKDHEKLCKK